MLEKLEATLIGVTPLIMHNGQTADPLNKFAIEMKSVTSKGAKKTTKDMEELTRIEFLAACYTDDKGEIALPADNLVALVIQGCRQNKRGKLATAGVIETQPYYPLIYKGPRKPAELYEEPRFVDRRLVVVNRGRVVRTRARFDEWQLPISLLVDTNKINLTHVHDAIVQAGESVGLCDYRPRFGRFRVEPEELNVDAR